MCTEAIVRKIGDTGKKTLSAWGKERGVPIGFLSRGKCPWCCGAEDFVLLALAARKGSRPKALRLQTRTRAVVTEEGQTREMNPRNRNH